MNKNIENITEELMMKYVEGNLDADESKKFQRILSQNQYLNKRVSILKSMSDSEPVKSPSKKVHHRILSDIGISNSGDISFIRQYIDSFMNIFERKPVLAGSFLSIFAAVLLSAVIIYNNMDSGYQDYRHITNEPLEQDKDKDSDSEDDFSRN